MMGLIRLEYNGDSDSDGFVLDNNENFDEVTNVEENEEYEENRNEVQPQEEENDKEPEESRKRERDESINYCFSLLLDALSKKKQKFAELKVYPCVIFSIYRREEKNAMSKTDLLLM